MPSRFELISSWTRKSGLFCLAAMPLLMVAGCGLGGGGGGDDEGFVGAAQVSLFIQPNLVDSGDRIKVRMGLSIVHEDGIALKIKYPTALSYVKDSARLEVDGADKDISPSYNVAVAEDNYLVFFLSQAKFGPDHFGDVVLELEAKSEAKDKKIEVDVDVDDPDIANSDEFNKDQPNFSAEAEYTFTVKG